MKKMIFATLVILILAVSCGGKKGADGVSGGGSDNSSGSASMVKAGTPAPASDFTVKLNGAGDGVEITAHTPSDLVKNLTIPATIEDLPVLSVSITSPTLEQIFVPEGVLSVNFRECFNLRAVSLPDSLKIIESFYGCGKLQSITIPPNVTSIHHDPPTAGGAFEGTAIQSITIPASVSNRLAATFKDCKNLVKAEISGTELKLYETFRGCDSLQTVIINDGVKEIGDFAFSRCTVLQSISLPNSLTVIRNLAFSDCTSLTSVAIPHGVEWIGESAFSGCTSLESISLPNTIRVLQAPFGGCENLTTVELEEGTAIQFLDSSFNTRYMPKLSLKSQAAIKAASK